MRELMLAILVVLLVFDGSAAEHTDTTRLSNCFDCDDTFFDEHSDGDLLRGKIQFASNTIAWLDFDSYESPVDDSFNGLYLRTEGACRIIIDYQSADFRAIIQGSWMDDPKPRSWFSISMTPCSEEEKQ